MGIGNSEREGFARRLQEAWAIFRAGRGQWLSIMVAAAITVLPGLLGAASSRNTCSLGPVEVDCPVEPVGPGGKKS